MDDPHLAAMAHVPDVHLLAGQACFNFFAAERRAKPDHKTRAT